MYVPQKSPDFRTKEEKAYSYYNQLLCSSKENGELFSLFKNLETAINKNHSFITFKYSKDNAELHYSTTVITKYILNQGVMSDLWENFLKSLNGVWARYPDKQQYIQLDFTPEIALLNRSTPKKIFVERCFHEGNVSKKDRDVVWQITNEAFGIHELLDREFLEKEFAEKNVIFLVAREHGTEEIVGHLFCKIENSVGDIQVISRKANRALRGIGTALLSSLINEYANQFFCLTLCVRSSNLVAQKLYGKFGFKKLEKIIYSRSCPSEFYWKMIFWLNEG